MSKPAEMAPCIMCGSPEVPEGSGPLCTGCEDGQALEAIADLVRQSPWSPDTMEAIRDILRGTGRNVET